MTTKKIITTYADLEFPACQLCLIVASNRQKYFHALAGPRRSGRICLWRWRRLHSTLRANCCPSVVVNVTRIRRRSSCHRNNRRLRGNNQQLMAGSSMISLVGDRNWRLACPRIIVSRMDTCWRWEIMSINFYNRKFHYAKDFNLCNSQSDEARNVQHRNHSLVASSRSFCSCADAERTPDKS